MKAQNSHTDLATKIYEGLKLSFKKLLAQKKRDKGTLVFSENGKITKVKIGK